MAEKLHPRYFVLRYGIAAAEIEKRFGIPREATLAQAAIESSWGSNAPGFNFFGYKTGLSWEGKRQLLWTTEYHKSPDVKYPVIKSITKHTNGYKYIVKDYFREYDHPYQSFYDYALLIALNKRYEGAFKYSDPADFLATVYRSGYATDPAAIQLGRQVVNMIKKYT